MTDLKEEEEIFSLKKKSVYINKYTHIKIYYKISFYVFFVSRKLKGNNCEFFRTHELENEYLKTK